jgi:di/tricarboxylate transporter
MTILGSPANMMVLNYAMQNGYNLSFLNWMIIAVPVSIVIFLI